jgi:hypothetical protein
MKMLFKIKLWLPLLIISLFLTTGVLAVSRSHSRTLSLGVDGGYFFPQGQWNDHPYAGIDQFQKSWAFGGDLEVRLWQWGGIGVGGGYLGLDMSAWEDFARQTGDDLEASAEIWYYCFLFKPYISTTKPDMIKAHIGFGSVATTGQEIYGVQNYAYNFLKSKAGYFFGIEYDRYISRKAAIALKASFVIVPSGVEYADKRNYKIMGFPLTIGARFDF